MSFGDIWGKAWKDYKTNLPAIVKAGVIFYALPLIMAWILVYGVLIGSGVYTKISEVYGSSLNQTELEFRMEQVFENIVLSNLTSSIIFITLIILIFIAIFLLSMFAYIGITSASLKKEKFSFKDIIENGKKHYWGALGFSIVSVIFLAGLFLLLIIPGIIFSVFWAFGFYVFLNENRGIIESLRRSFYLVKGKWWKTFGYTILFFLIFYVITLVFGLPGLIARLAVLSGYNFSFNAAVGVGIVDWVLSLISVFITYPLAILFFKNFYFEMKKEKKK